MTVLATAWQFEFVTAMVVLISAALSGTLTWLFRPILAHYALATPNARSSHREPTPQGGGIALILAALTAVALSLIPFRYGDAAPTQLFPVVAATVLIASVGAVDDMRNLSIGFRLPLQGMAVAIVITSMSQDIRIVPDIPLWLERAFLIVCGVYFVNVVNFMDGIDWMTVATVVPITGGLVIMGFLGALPSYGSLVALALLGAMIGFAPFNRPVASIFLGDVGSLPIGLLVGWLLVLVAANGRPVAATLLPLYYLADATLTLLNRIVAGERFWQAHRTHFYQRATDRGFSVIAVDLRVFIVNVILVALAISSALASSWAIDLMAVVTGMAVVAWLLMTFARGNP